MSRPLFDLSGEELTEVIVLGVISTISTVSVSLLLLHLFITSVISGKEKDNDEQILLRTHFGVFALFLFLCDLAQGLAGMIELGWASKQRITPGSLCTAQGVMLQIGDVGTAVWNAILALHTFWAVVLGRKMTVRAAITLAVIGWATCLLLTAIGPLAIQTPENGPFYGVTDAWCFITDLYPKQRILLHYLPMLLSALIITVLYVLVALVLFRILIVNGSTWRFEAPTRKSGSVVRDFFGQFSWGRLYRNSDSAGIQSVVNSQHPDASPTRPPKDTPGLRWDISSSRPGNRSKSVVNISEYENPLSATSSRLRRVAVKMLWYPSVYLVLILPVTLSRIAPSINSSVSVLLGFTCMLLFMGTANTIIFVFTRRLGPAPWARRISFWQNNAERGKVRSTQEQGNMRLQIRIDRHMQRGGDHSIDLPRRKSHASILTDITTLSSIPSAVHRDSNDDDFNTDRPDSKAGIEFSGKAATRILASPSSPSHPYMVGVHQFHRHSPELHWQYSPHPFTHPEPPAPQNAQGQPQGWIHPHPYSRSSPIG